MKTLPILVTGAAGFIASRWVQSCLKRGISVIAVDDLTYFSNRKELQNIFSENSKNYGVEAVVPGQALPKPNPPLRVERKELFSWLQKESPQLQAVVHLGACTDTTELDVALLNCWNLEYSQKLWQWCTSHHVPLVYASSAATYGAGELGYDDEEALLQKLKPLNPYGESKHHFDLWALSEERQAKAPPVWSGFKFFNVYGFGELHKEKMASVILHAFHQIQQTGRVKLFRSYRSEILHGHQARDFIFVDDVIRVLWFALEKPIRRGIFNLGTGQARTYLDLVKAVFHTLGVSENIEFIDMPSDLKDRYQYFTEAKMQKLKSEGYLLPFTSLESGVAQYVRALQQQS